MESVNVVVCTSIDDEGLRQISSISPEVKLRNASDLFQAEQRGTLAFQKEFDALLAEAEVIYGLRFPENVIARAPKLKWIQTISAGVDKLASEIMRSSVIVTNASGVYNTPVAEFVLQLMLMFAKRAPSYFQFKQKRQWKQLTSQVLCSQTVGIVGLGSIGREVARLAKAFGMRVVTTRRSAKTVSRAKNIDVMLPRERLHQLLSESDFVVLTVPLTHETNNLIGEKELRTMKSTAYLIHVSRGNVVNEEVVIRALNENWIAGAGLDAFATEPLPSESRLWELPNVILSPHVAFKTEDIHMKATELFCENLRRYLNGKKLLNVVSKKKGY